MNTQTISVGVCLMGEHLLDLQAFAQACAAQVEAIHELVDEGLLQPTVAEPPWRFGGEALARARRIFRLQRDFEANLQSVAVMLQLLDDNERLRAALLRAGIKLPDETRA
jgi:chaperone modulatory protein CbpM